MNESILRYLFRMVGVYLVSAAWHLSEQLRRRPRSLSHPNEVVVVGDRHFSFIKESLRRDLESLGIDVEVADTIVNPDDPRLHIICAPQVFPELPPTYVAYQFEQLPNSSWLTPKYMKILGGAVACWDYSLVNVELLRGLGYPGDRLHYVPVHPHVSERMSSCRDDLDRRDIDVLFYGSLASARRRECLRILERCFGVVCVDGLFGNDVLDIISRARVVVNIHFYEDALLETLRVSEVISQGTPIVSESAPDADNCALEGLVTFVRVGDWPAMIEAVERLLGDDDYWCRTKREMEKALAHSTEWQAVRSAIPGFGSVRRDSP